MVFNLSWLNDLTNQGPPSDRFWAKGKQKPGGKVVKKNQKGKVIRIKNEGLEQNGRMIDWIVIGSS